MPVAILILSSVLSLAAPQRLVHVAVGAGAPPFRVTDDTGATRALADYRGMFVVLEWHETGCPYVTKHYRGGAMQTRQKA